MFVGSGISGYNDKNGSLGCYGSETQRCRDVFELEDYDSITRSGRGDLLRDIDRRSQVVVRNEAESGCATKGKCVGQMEESGVWQRVVMEELCETADCLQDGVCADKIIHASWTREGDDCYSYMTETVALILRRACLGMSMLVTQG